MSYISICDEDTIKYKGRLISIHSFITYSHIYKVLRELVFSERYIIEDTNRTNSMSLYDNRDDAYLILKKTSRKCPRIYDIVWVRCKTPEQWISNDNDINHFLKDKLYIDDGGSCIFYTYKSLYYKVVNRRHFIDYKEYDKVRKNVNKLITKHKGNLLLSKVIDKVNTLTTVDIYEVEYYDKKCNANVKDILIMLISLLEIGYMVNDVHPRNIRCKDNVNYYLDICDVKPYSKRYWDGFKSFCTDVDNVYKTNIFTKLSLLEFDDSKELIKCIKTHIL